MKLKANEIELEEYKKDDRIFIRLKHKNCGYLKPFNFENDICDQCGRFFHMFIKNW